MVSCAAIYAALPNGRSFAYNDPMTRRSEILATAGDLFRENGYHATSMRDIAKTLNLRGSSLYAHISSKEEMLWEIVNHAADAFLARAEASSTVQDPLERLRALIRGHLQVIVSELPNATVFFHEWRFLSDDRKNLIIARRDAYERHFRRVIQDGIQSGLFQVDDPKVASLFVLSALNWSYQWLSLSGPLNLDELAKQYTQLILNALKYEQTVTP